MIFVANFELANNAPIVPIYSYYFANFKLL
jgi:hypothetical protein